jgi:hypothetical protein
VTATQAIISFEPLDEGAGLGSGRTARWVDLPEAETQRFMAERVGATVAHTLWTTCRCTPRRISWSLLLLKLREETFRNELRNPFLLGIDVVTDRGLPQAIWNALEFVFWKKGPTRPLVNQPTNDKNSDTKQTEIASRKWGTVRLLALADGRKILPD